MHEHQPQQHEMVLEKTHDSGVEEWYCPTCGRRFLMQWPPEYKKIILEEGDGYAIHSGGKGDISMGPPSVELVSNAVPEVELDSESLEPWLVWFDQVDFESLWNKEL